MQQVYHTTNALQQGKCNNYLKRNYQLSYDCKHNCEQPLLKRWLPNVTHKSLITWQTIKQATSALRFYPVSYTHLTMPTNREV